MTDVRNVFSIERLRRRALPVALSLMAPLIALGIPSIANATPTGKFAVFSDCPLSTPNLAQCIYSTTTSGEVKIGSSIVPIKATIVLQGGLIKKTEAFVGAADGNTMSKTPENVPGGLAGLINCEEITNLVVRLGCKVIFEEGLTQVTATTELAAPASSIVVNQGNLLDEEGVALALPIKVKLENVLLGNECYIGSNADPITLNLTTGATSPPSPNKLIKGSAGKINVIEGLLTDEGNSLVDNSFAAPKAEGCGELLAAVVDPVVNAKIELPAAAGRNTAILDGELQSASPKVVQEHE